MANHVARKASPWLGMLVFFSVLAAVFALLSYAAVGVRDSVTSAGMEKFTKDTGYTLTQDNYFAMRKALDFSSVTRTEMSNSESVYVCDVTVTEKRYRTKDCILAG